MMIFLQHKRYLLLSLMLLLLTSASAAFADKGLMQVTFLDCDQGDCIIIRNDNKTIMIDAGDNKKEVAEQHIIPYFKKEGIKRVDQAIITHPHRDHFGGFAELIKHFKVGEVVYSNDSSVFPEEGEKKSSDAIYYQQLTELLKTKRIPYRRAKAGERLNWGEGVKAEVLFTDDGSFGDISKNNVNEMSMIIKATFGKISYLFTGDAEKKAELAAIKKYGKRLKSTVLKSGHHGSKTSSTHAFMDMVQPKYGVISCGKNNSFGHPTQSTLDVYDYYKMTVFRTDQDGTIESMTDGDTILFDSNKTPMRIAEQPRVISSTPTTVTIQWESNREALSEAKLSLAVRAAKAPAGTSQSCNHLSKVHTVTFNKLVPGQMYQYEVSSIDPKTKMNVAKATGVFRTPSGSADFLPGFKTFRAKYNRVFMKTPFDIMVNVKNFGDKPAKDITLTVFHSTRTNANLVGEASIKSIKPGAQHKLKVPAQIDWLGNVELIGVLKKGNKIIDTASTVVYALPKKILVDCSHGNKEYYMGAYSSIKMDLFQNGGFQMKHLSKPVNFNQLHDAFVFMISNPKKEYSDAEIHAIKKYVAGGGSLLLCCSSDYKDLSRPDILNALIKNIGGHVRFNDDQVVDDKSLSAGASWRFFLNNFPEKDITGSKVKKLQTLTPCSLINSNNIPLKTTKSIKVLIRTSPNGKSTENDKKGDAKYLYNPIKDKDGVPLAACESINKSRIAYYGDTFYKDNLYTNKHNLDAAEFNIKVMEWLTAPRSTSVQDIVNSVSRLEEEPDPELKAIRFERLSTELIDKIKYDEESIDDVKKELQNYADPSVRALQSQIEEIERFKELYGEE